MSTQSKTAIVTGASQGIGAGIVNGFLDRGFNIVASSRKVKDGKLAEKIESVYLRPTDYSPLK